MQPVVEFWQGLTNIPDPADRAKALEKFYFEGLSPKFRPVVHVGNFGGDEAGQLRGNIFVNGKWQLREWRVQISPTTLVPEFLVETVKNNPLPEFYAEKFALSDDLRKLLGAEADAAEEIGKEELLRYQGEFLRSYVANLLVLDNKGRVSQTTEDINRLGLGSDNRYNDFQSISEGPVDLPEEFIRANPKFKELVEAVLAHHQKNVIDESKKIKFEHLLNRAAAGTCAGCHETAATKLVSPGVPFPAPVGHPNGFVHIDEGGNLSPALTGHFLPFRKQVLLDTLCPPPGMAALAAPAAPAAPATDVNKVLRALRQEPSLERRLQIGAEAERAIRQQRAKEYAAPGAFVRNRRPH